MTKVSASTDYAHPAILDPVSLDKKNGSKTRSASASERTLQTNHSSAEPTAPGAAETGQGLGVKVDPRTGDIVVVVYSKKDNRIIEEIPPEAARELSLQLDKLTGLLVDRYE